MKHNRKSNKNHRHRRFRIKKQTKRYIAVLLAFVLFVGVFVLGVHFWESRNFRAPVDEEVDSIETDSEKIQYNGNWYQRNDNIDTILFIGLDKFGKTESKATYINNQQADFLLLVSVDRASKEISAVQINRDTMTDVKVLGVGGIEATTDTMQIALAHTYGSGRKDSCANTVKAVSNLLYGVTIDHYISLTMDAISAINDSLGGVTVKVEDDFSNVDSTLVQGTEVTLLGKHALNFIRARGSMPDSDNTRRMVRQQTYMDALVAKMREVYSTKGEDAFYDILVNISPYLTTDYTNAQMKKLVSLTSDYDYSGIQNIDGEIKDGKEYKEFYASDEKLKQLVIDNYFVITDVMS